MISRYFFLVLLLQFSMATYAIPGCYREDSQSDNINRQTNELSDKYQLGSIPTFYINTNESQDITSKENYIEASFWIVDTIGGYNVGSIQSPKRLNIKGRGNATWSGFEKKPYRIKLEEKTSLLGMKKDKHFVLLTGVDDLFMGFMKYPVAYELSRRIGLGWIPEVRYVELVLNGDYRELYYLIEKIRVDKNRVAITEQEDGEEDFDKVSGGWLLEIDNYDDEQQLQFEEGNGKVLRITYHSPDSLSDIQRQYLKNYISECDKAIYTVDKTNNDWENYIDIESLAKYYIINEVLHNAESFMGSCYMYKERGVNEKLHFGPIWDLGSLLYYGDLNNYFYINPRFDDIHWITEIVKYPHFQEVVKKIWSSFKNDLNLDEFEDEILTRIQTAVQNNYTRWPVEGWDRDSQQKDREKFDHYRETKIGFLNDVWASETDISSVTANYCNINRNDFYSLSGIKIYDTRRIKGVYLSNGKKFIGKNN